MLRVLYQPVAVALCALSASSACLASDGGVVFGSHISTPEIITIDPDTAQWTPFGTTGGVGAMAGMAYAPSRDTLFGVGTNPGNLYELNQATGEASVIGSMGFGDPAGLAYDTTRDVLYAVRVTNTQLFGVDPDTGSSFRIGEVGGGQYGHMEGLAYDSLAGILYGLSDHAQALLAIDVYTADATVIDVGLPVDQWRALTFDRDEGVLYASSVTPSLFYRIDVAHGSTSFIGELVDAGALHGLAYKPIPAPSPLVAMGLVWGALSGRPRRSRMMPRD